MEIILAIGLLSVIGTATLGLIRNSSEDFLFASRRSHLLQEGQSALTKMSRTLRQAKKITSVTGPSDTEGSITFDDPDGVEYQFDLDTGSDELGYGQTGSLYALANSVSNLTFTCYDDDGASMSAPVDAGDVRSMEIEMTVTDATDSDISFDLSTRVYWPMKNPEVIYWSFSEAKATGNKTAVTVSTPSCNEGDLLIAAIVTDAKETISPPSGEGWTEIDQGRAPLDQATFGVWWKLAEASESSTHRFTWGTSEESYAWIMRFEDHDPDNPIHDWSVQTGTSVTPTSPSVTTTVESCLILRMIALEDYGCITVDSPGVPSNTTITMDYSSATSLSCCGGAAYHTQESTGSSGTNNFSFLTSDQYRAMTIAIAPD